MSIFLAAEQPNPHAPENRRDMTILVQRLVIEQLNLSQDFNEASEKYFDLGYSEKCRELIETDPEIRVLLEQGRLEEAARMLTDLLREWKQMRI